VIVRCSNVFVLGACLALALASKTRAQALPGSNPSGPQPGAIGRGIAELEAAVARMQAAGDPNAARAAKALKNIKAAYEGKRPGPPGTQGPAETRLRVGPNDPARPWRRGTDAVTTEERRFPDPGGGTRVEGGTDLMGGTESVCIAPDHLDGDGPGEPPGWEDALNGAVLGHEGERLEQVYSRNVNPANITPAELKQMYENMNAAYALQKILLINIRASKEGPANAALRQKLQDRIKAVQEAIDENNRKIQGLGG
jgi:hypothetical protein